MAELVDAHDSNSCTKVCGFDSHSGYKASEKSGAFFICCNVTLHNHAHWTSLLHHTELPTF